LKGEFKRSGVFSQCRDKDSLGIFCLRDESLEEPDNLPDPDVLAQEIVEDLKAALEMTRTLGRSCGRSRVSYDSAALPGLGVGQ
jgi:hypothetical protein